MANNYEDGVSVVVCCYNSSARLPQTINCLAEQIVPEGIKWEIVLVDNASTDNTSEFAEREWKKYSISGVQVRVIYEKQPGLFFAKKTGFKNIRYKYVVFCDDDNWLSDNYIHTMYKLFGEHKSIAIIGSKSLLKYDSEPPAWFLEHARYFAIGEQGEPGDVTDSRGFVWGAGMAIRSESLKLFESLLYKPVFRGRIGGQMTSGEDVELCLCFRILGFRIMYSDRCSLEHYMPASRFQEPKFIELNYQNGFAAQYFEILYDGCFFSKVKLFKMLLATCYYFLWNFFKDIGRADTLDKRMKVAVVKGMLAGSFFLIKNYGTLKNNFSYLKR